MYQAKVVGALCSNCKQANYVQNPKTGKVFCPKKCWLTQSGTNVPNQYQNAPQASFNPSQATVDDLQRKLDELNLAFSKMRVWAQRIEKEVDGLLTLSVDLKGKTATELHTGFTAPEPPKDWKFDVNKEKEILTDSEAKGLQIKMPEGGL